MLAQTGKYDAKEMETVMPAINYEGLSNKLVHIRDTPSFLSNF